MTNPQFPRTFTVTEDHMKLLKNMWVSWDDGEYGAPAIDCKRPYGNSGVPRDIHDILGWHHNADEDLTDEQYDRARGIHLEMAVVLQCLIDTTGTTFGPGTYVAENEFHRVYKRISGQGE